MSGPTAPRPAASRPPAGLVDTVHAFLGAPRVLVPGADEGPLAGTKLAVKDVIDVAGTVTGAGNPTFAAGRPAAAASAPVVSTLVGAGATVIGKTITDELAYSLSGTNVHHGTPRNPDAPGHIPGGSSAGSAAAAAAGICELALGTDTGGSIRVPASYCGLVGWRPTHGAVDVGGVVHLARSFDTVGLLARSIGILVDAAELLLAAGPAADPAPSATSTASTPDALGAPEARETTASEAAAWEVVAWEATAGEPGAGRPSSSTAPSPTAASFAAELLGVVEPSVAEAIRAAAGGWASSDVDLGIDLDSAVEAFRVLQGREAWLEHGDWITDAAPPMGPGIAARFAAAARITDEEVAGAVAVRDEVRRVVAQRTADGRVLVAPAAAGAAPALVESGDAKVAARARTLRLTCLAGLAGAPVVVLPIARHHDLPLGVACLGAPGSDLSLLHWARERLDP